MGMAVLQVKWWRRTQSLHLTEPLFLDADSATAFDTHSHSSTGFRAALKLQETEVAEGISNSVRTAFSLSTSKENRKPGVVPILRTTDQYH